MISLILGRLFSSGRKFTTIKAILIEEKKWMMDAFKHNFDYGASEEFTGFGYCNLFKVNIKISDKETLISSRSYFAQPLWN